MKIVIVSLILFVVQTVFADTVGPNCRIAWNYDVADEFRIDGFRLYQGLTISGIAGSSLREMSCEEAGVISGVNTMTATAYNAVGESEHSNSISFIFVETPPAPPEKVRILVFLP